MDSLISRMLEAGLHSSHDATAATAVEDGKQELVIEQVRVVNSADGQLKVVYPSRLDLQLESVKVFYQEKQ